MTGRRRGRSRVERALAVEWRAFAAVQWALIAAAGAQLAAVVTGRAVPGWVVAVDAALVAAYATGVLLRGRPPAETPARPARHNRA